MGGVVQRYSSTEMTKVYSWGLVVSLWGLMGVLAVVLMMDFMASSVSYGMTGFTLLQTAVRVYSVGYVAIEGN